MVIDAAGHIARVDSGTEMRGSLILATGSSPRALRWFDFDGIRILSSDHVPQIAQIPRERPVRGRSTSRNEVSTITPRRLSSGTSSYCPCVRNLSVAAVAPSSSKPSSNATTGT
jgi:hypothetical protein